MSFPPPTGPPFTPADAPNAPNPREWILHAPTTMDNHNDEYALAWRLLFLYGNRLRYFSQDDSTYFCDPATNLWAEVPRAQNMLANLLVADLTREARALEFANPTEYAEVIAARDRLSNREGARAAVGKTALTLPDPYLQSIGHQAWSTKPSDFFVTEPSNEITMQDARARITEEGIELLPAALPQDGFMRMLPYTADEVLNAGEPTMFMDSLRKFMPNEEVREFFSLRLGTNVLGKRHKRGLCILLYGTGRNGKSTILRAALTSLGDYAAPDQTIEFFVTDKRKSVNTDHMTFAYGLDGKRACTHAAEFEKGASLYESNLKNAIVMQPMDNRKMHSSKRTRLDLQASFYMAANTFPRTEVSDRATRRRFACIPMTVSMEDYGDQVNDFAEEIRSTEGAAVAGFQIRQAVNYLRESNGGRLRPIHIPQTIKEATEDWFSSTDPIAEFYQENLRPSSTEQVSHEEIYAAYKKWFEASTPISDSGLPSKMILLEDHVLGRLDRARHPQGKKGRITQDGKTRRVKYVKGRLLSPEEANACLPYDDPYEDFFEMKLEDVQTALMIETNYDSEEYWELHDNLRHQYPQSYFEQNIAQLEQEYADAD